MPDAFKPRPVQKRMLTSVINNLDNDNRINVWDVHPGTGKTLGVLAVLNELFRRSVIDATAIYTPRLNLCTQFETDWNRGSKLFDKPRMGKIVHRSNEKDDLLQGDRFGFVSTYQSLNADLTKHYRAFRKHHQRIALVADEAQILGASYESSGTGTAAAENIKILSDAAAVIIVMSGTAYRSDGKELLFGTYTEPSEKGDRFLQPDVKATYFEGVAEQYLRPFEYELHDGEALYEYLDGDVDDLVISELDSGLTKVLENKGYWEPLVDKTIDTVFDMKRVDRRFCGLIGAANQSHAKKIIEYLKRRKVSSLLAVSDEMAAQDNMRKFKSGNYDILVTVAMAHVGYDHKPIIVVTCLNPYRASGWLDQFFARGMRIMDDVPIEAQTLKGLVPQDPRMIKYVEDKRAESEQGLRERRTREGGERTIQEQLGQVTMASLTSVTAMGIDPKGDVNPDEYSYYVEAKKRFNIGPANITGLHLFAQEVGTTNKPPVRQNNSGTLVKQPQLTENEREKLLRKEVNKLARQAARLAGQEYKYYFVEMLRHFDKPLSQCSVSELEVRRAWLLQLPVWG